MADDRDAKAAGEGSSDWAKVHEQARKQYSRGYERERANIDNAYADLKFRRGEIEDQWSPEALEARKGRPCLVVNLIPKFIRQVTGDMRQMRPGVKAVPVDSRGDIKTADVQSGMFRYIENRSYAKHVYTTGADSQVTCGIAHWRVGTEYASHNTFNQEVRILGIEDGVSVIWDADSFMPTREDAGHCFVPVDMSLAAFKDKWPDAQASDFGEKIGDNFSGWVGDDYVRVAEYWVKKPIKRTLALYPDGSIDDLTDNIANSDDRQIADSMEFLQSQGVRIEKRDGHKVCRYLMTCAEILEEEDWPGMHIPIVPVIGEEVRIGREVYRHGIVRYARDPQRMNNYYASADAEVIALQPKAPWVGTKKMFEKHYDLWETANTENHPFLEFTPDPNMPGAKPERVMPPVASQAIQAGRMQAAMDLQNVIGIYEGNLGDKSNETSGKAIVARDRQADTGTFVYMDNFALAIQRTAQIVGDLFPHVYDTQRMMRIVGIDGKEQVVEINKPIMEGGLNKIENDVTVGAYDFLVEPGPSYATRREEAREMMTAFIQAVPDAAPFIGDLYAKSQDWPMADEIGERLEFMLPPQVKAKMDADRQKNRSPLEEPEAPIPPTPAEQMQIKGAELELEGKAAEIEKTRAETAKIAREAMAPPEAPQIDPSAIVQAEHEAAMNQIKLAAAVEDLETQRRLNAIKIEDAALKLAQSRAGIAMTGERHDIDMAGRAEALAQGAEKHGMSMAQQEASHMHGEEKHQAMLKNMERPERPA